MPKALAPVDLTAGEQFNVDLSTVTPNPVQGVVFQNLSGFNLTLIYGGSDYNLPPGMNDYIAVTPNSGQVIAVSVGVTNTAPAVPNPQLQGNVYLVQEPAPVGYPMVNPAYVTAVAGQQLIGNFVIPAGRSNNESFELPEGISNLLFLCTPTTQGDFIQVEVNYVNAPATIIMFRNPPTTGGVTVATFQCAINPSAVTDGLVNVQYDNTGAGPTTVLVFGYDLPPEDFNGVDQPLYTEGEEGYMTQQLSYVVSGGAGAVIVLNNPPNGWFYHITFISFANFMSGGGTLNITGLVTAFGWIQQSIASNTTPGPFPWNPDLSIAEGLKSNVGGTGPLRVTVSYRLLPLAR